MKLTELLSLSEIDFQKVVGETAETDFYDKLVEPGFVTRDTFPVRIPFRIGSKKVEVKIPIKIDMSLIRKEMDQYLQAPPELKKQFDVSVYWYDNFNKLIFGNLPETDACMFLAACAYTSVNTGLDQNVLQAAKLLMTVKHDFAMPNGKEYLKVLSDRVKNNDTNESLAFIKQYADRGSEYAGLLAHKLDYKGGMSKMGHKKGQEDVFNEITVSNAKLPNFNEFVKYYLKKGGDITQKELFQDVKSGNMKIGGTKITSFFLNLVFPGYMWGEGENAVDPATVDRWMIMVFFEVPLTEMAQDSIGEWIEHVTETGGEVANDPVSDPQTEVRARKPVKSPEEVSLEKRKAALLANQDKIVMKARDQLFTNDTVRQNLVKIMNDEGKKIGMKSYQLQALAWVNIRDRHGEAHSRFATYEEVMAFAKEAAEGILQLDPNINDVTKTVHILAHSLRFSGVNKQDVVNTLQNRDKYIKRYFLPPKADVEKKAQQKIKLDALTWTNMRVDLIDDNNADILDLTQGKVGTKTDKQGRSKDVFKPLHKGKLVTISGNGRKDVLSKALRWIINYNPERIPSS